MQRLYKPHAVVDARANAAVRRGEGRGPAIAVTASIVGGAALLDAISVAARMRLDWQAPSRLVRLIVDEVDLAGCPLLVSKPLAGNGSRRVASERDEPGPFCETVGPVPAFTLAR